MSVAILGVMTPMLSDDRIVDVAVLHTGS
jgi:hypothetical protein